MPVPAIKLTLKTRKLRLLFKNGRRLCSSDIERCELFGYFVLILCFAQQNFPLYLRTAPGHHDGELQFHHSVHTAIDVIEEKSEPVV